MGWEEGGSIGWGKEERVGSGMIKSRKGKNLCPCKPLEVVFGREIKANKYFKGS